MSQYDDKGLPVRKSKESSGNVTCRFDQRTNELMAELRAHWTKTLNTNLSQTETLRAAIWHAAEAVLPNLFKEAKQTEAKQTEGCQNCYPVKDGNACTCDACGRGLEQDTFSETMVIQGYATPTAEGKAKAAEVASKPAPVRKAKKKKE